MGLENNGSLSFGKKLGSVSFEKFNGVSAEDLKNSQLSDVQKQLADAILGKYNQNGDTLLDKSELSNLQNDLFRYAKDGELGKREAGKFFKDLNLKGLKREDIYAVMQYIASDTDSIDNAETKDGITTIKYKPTEGGVVVEDKFKDVDGKQVRQSQTKTNINEPEGTYVTDYFDGETKTKSEFYQDNKLSMLEEFSGNTTTTTLYENGEVSSKTRTTGAVTEELDSNDNVTKRTTNKGSGITETVEYTYNEDGTITETTTGSDPVTVRKDKDGNVIPEEKPQEDYVHTVKAGDTWYGIVQAKYGITDHKQTMEIVHQLKDAAGIKYNEVKIPKEITLPAKVTLKNGKEIPLGDTNAVVDTKHNRPVESTDSADDVVEVDPKPPVIKPFQKPVLRPAPLQDPLPPRKEDNIDWLNFTCPEKANKTVENPDGTKTKYDENGRVDSVFDKNGNTIYSSFTRGKDGKVESYHTHEYDARSNITKDIYRREDGSVIYFNDYEHDMSGKCIRNVLRNSDGSIYSCLDIEYNEFGKEVCTIKWNSDGIVESYTEYEYDSAGNKIRTIERGADGNVEYYYNHDDYKSRNVDGTLRK